MSTDNKQTNWQRVRKNERKRLQEFKKAIQEYIANGKKIILKKEPTLAMVMEAKKYNINAYDFYYETLSPEEQRRREQAERERWRRNYGKEAMESKGKYNPTGERQSLEDKYQSMEEEEKLNALKEQLIQSDILRGWRCPICKKLYDDEDVDEKQVKFEINGHEFFFHPECFEDYDRRYVQPVNDSEPARERVSAAKYFSSLTARPIK